jgi:UDP-3-O-[3-hydroxymyristoyl] glucosamine N-acyltransferase
VIHKLALVGEPPEHRDWEPRLPVLTPQIDPSADIGAFATIDGGLERSTTVGARSFLMKHVHIGHDACIGADCELAPGVVVGGHCQIDDRVRIGVNACLRPFVHVGEGARIGAGAVVVNDVPAGEVWVGNPARDIKSVESKKWERQYG